MPLSGAASAGDRFRINVLIFLFEYYGNSREKNRSQIKLLDQETWQKYINHIQFQQKCPVFSFFHKS